MNASVLTVAVVLAVLTLVNVSLLGLTLKLYTEVFKELAQRRRADR